MNASADKRTFERIPFSQKVNVITMSRVAAYAMAINLGMGGVLLRSATKLPVGSQCRVTLPVAGNDGGKPFVADGTVIRSDTEGTVVQFLNTIDQTRFHNLFQPVFGTQGSILASYQAYFRVSRNQDLADCEKLLGVSKRTFRTTFYISFVSCISAAVLSVWFFRSSIPVAPNWVKVLFSFIYGAIWLVIIQPTIDLTAFRFLRQRQSSRSSA